MELRLLDVHHHARSVRDAGGICQCDRDSSHIHLDSHLHRVPGCGETQWLLPGTAMLLRFTVSQRVILE